MMSGLTTLSWNETVDRPPMRETGHGTRRARQLLQPLDY